MPTHLDRTRARQCLEAFDLKTLFIEELGWDRGGAETEATVAGRTYLLEAIAHKRGLVAYQYVADSDGAFPDYLTRQKIEKSVAKTVREHLIVYVSHGGNVQYWQWVKREPGRPDRLRQHIYHWDQPGEALIQKLEQIAFTLDEEEDLTIVNVSAGCGPPLTWRRSPKSSTNVSRKSIASFWDSSKASKMWLTGNGTPRSC